MMRTVPLLIVVGALAPLGVGCAANPRNPDPFEPANRVVFAFNDGLDKFIVKPVSDVYVGVVPRPVRKGLGNAFDNLGQPNVALNDFLQGKMDRGLGALGRFAVNSTIGVAGIFDVATGMGLKKHSNDFGVTLGVHNATAGPYLVLPLFGPSTFRDAPAVPVRMLTNPLRYADVPDYVSLPLDVLNVAESRVRVGAAIELRDRAAVDPYIFTREAYLQMRRARIDEARGVPTTPAAPPDFYEDDGGAGPTTAPATRPAGS